MRFRLRGFDSIVGTPNLPPDIQALRCLVRDYHPRQPQTSSHQPLAIVLLEIGQRPGVGGKPLPLEKGVVIRHPDRRAGLMNAGDFGVIVVEKRVVLPFQQVLGNQIPKIHQLHISGLVLHGDVKGRLLVCVALDGAVQADAACGDADGQQKKDTDHRLGQVGGVDPAQPLAQGEQVEVCKIKPGVPLGKLHHKAGQGFENQQGPNGAQRQHHHADRQDGDCDSHAKGEQDRVSGRQADHTQHQLDHRHPQGTLAQLLVFPLPLHQVNELGFGHLHAAEQHHD